MAEQQHNRILDLSTFVGDTWAVQATQAVPFAEAVQRLVVRQSPVRITLRPLDGIKTTSDTVADDVTTCDVRVVKIHLGELGVEFTEMLSSIVESGGAVTKLGRGVSESDVDIGQIIVIGFPVLTPGGADGLAVYVSGADPIPVQ